MTTQTKARPSDTPCSHCGARSYVLDIDGDLSCLHCGRYQVSPHTKRVRALMARMKATRTQGDYNPRHNGSKL